MKIALVTGGFDPLHSGHLAYLREASKLADELWVGVNSDEWLARKKGKPFMPSHERLEILDNLEVTSRVFAFKDDDETAIEALKLVLTHPNVSEVIFCNGGDRTKDNIPEQDAFKTISATGMDSVVASGGSTLTLASSSDGFNISASATTDTITFQVTNVPNSALQNSTIVMTQL